MPSMLHEGLLLLFRNRPMLAPELLRDTLHVELPAFTEARVDSADLTQLQPVEYRADLVVLLLEGQPVYAIVVEVQLNRDDRKLESWPVYLTNLRARLHCPASLLVVTPEDAVARWASRPIALGHPGFELRPIVLGPNAVPIVADAQEVARDPELAVLSAMAHGEHLSSVDVARALIAVVPGLDDERKSLYLDLVVLSLRDAARAAFEGLMQSNYEYQSDFARKYYGQGRDKGIEEGRLKGEAAALLQVLASRRIEVDAVARARVESCEDPVQLMTWLQRVATVTSVDELFAAAQ